jgi:hypothetical protein
MNTKHLIHMIIAAASLAVVTANAAIITISTADGSGADAYTNSNTGSNENTTAFGDTDANRMLIRRSNTKAYMTFDLGSYSGIGQVDTFTAVTLTIQQINAATPTFKTLEVFGINLNYNFADDSRLGFNWGETALTHANAPASGAGGSASTANSRSQAFGYMVADAGNIFFSYTETSDMPSTPMLDYLNGISGFSNTDTLLRSLIITEVANGIAGTTYLNDTKQFATKETGLGTLAPTLTLTYTAVPEPALLPLLAGAAAICLIVRRRLPSRSCR